MEDKNTDFEVYFADIFDKYYSRIYFYVLSISSNSDDAADISQETFIRFYEKREFFENESKIRGWLFRVSHNMVMDKFRKLRKLFFSEFTHEIACVDIDREEQENYLKLMREFDRLSDKHREILYLKYYENLSYEEISEILEINQGTVMSRISRAKEKLREVMKDE